MTDREQNLRVRERFTRSADAFSRFAVPYRLGDTEVIARLADLGPGDNGLDLACGPGTFTLTLARRARVVFGLDLTPALLDLARQRLDRERVSNVALVCADASALPYPERSLDVAVSGYSFHHMTRPVQALQELARVVRPGGRLAVVDLVVPDGAEPDANDRIERARDASHAHTLPGAELLKIIETAGFRIRSTELLERPRLFADWMRVAGWEPRDPAWRDTRRLMEAALSDDAGGFHARLLPGDETPEPEIEFTQTAMFVGALKPEAQTA